MSQRDVKMAPIRSELSVPATDSRKIERALASDADAVFLDLEDSVAAARKISARAAAIEALTARDWRSLPRAVRLNALDSPWFFRDLTEIGTAVANLEKFIVPKIEFAADVEFLDRLLTQIEREVGRTEQIGLELQIEDARGLLAAREIAAASHRVREVTFGQGDFAAATGMPAVEIGVIDDWDRAVSGDRWLAARQTIVFAARAAGVRALNGPYSAFRDEDGFRSYCRMSRALGFDGVWCIHPAQITIANDVFAPTEEEIVRAEATVAAMHAAHSAGQGAADHHAVMIDEASARMARSVLETAARINRRK